jgi:hypothetical protein
VAEVGDGADGDRVVAGGDELAEIADEPGEGAGEKGDAVADLVGDAVELVGLGALGGEDGGDLALVAGQDVDGEAAGLADDREGPGGVLEADEEEEGLEREGADGVGGHPAGPGGPEAGDDRDTGGEVTDHRPVRALAGRWHRAYLTISVP